jgi:flagellar biosynthesis component FlhA
MRAREFVIEAGVIAGMKQDYQQGYDAVDRILNPKRWGEEERSDVSASEPINKLNLKDAVNLAASSKTLYLKDQQALKQAYAQIKSGEFKVKQDAAVLLPVLKAAADLQTLSPQQQQILTAFARNL